jgi:hypothetical protein
MVVNPVLKRLAAAMTRQRVVEVYENYFFLAVFLTAFFAFFAGMYPPLVRILPAQDRVRAGWLRNGQMYVEKGTRVSLK